jgi:hypothetical protein
MSQEQHDIIENSIQNLAHATKEIFLTLSNTSKKVDEIHQRQQEMVIPLLERHDKILNGNGKPGLCERVTTLEAMKAENNFQSGIIVAVVAVVVSVITSIFSWIFHK